MILDEVHRNLMLDAGLSREQADWRLDQMREAFPDATATGFERLMPVMTNHEKDRHVVAAAIGAGAQVIVTSNLTDFPPEALEPFNIAAQSPDEFLLHLRGLAPRRMAEILREQAAGLRRRPNALAYVFEHLAVQAPEFATRMRRSLRV